MNFNLTQMPDRLVKPRQSGITMVMDKGLSLEEARNFMSVSHPHVDLVKLGFGTSYVTPDLEKSWRSIVPITSRSTLAEPYSRPF